VGKSAAKLWQKTRTTYYNVSLGTTSPLLQATKLRAKVEAARQELFQPDHGAPYAQRRDTFLSALQKTAHTLEALDRHARFTKRENPAPQMARALLDRIGPQASRYLEDHQKELQPNTGSAAAYFNAYNTQYGLTTLRKLAAKHDASNSRGERPGSQIVSIANQL
jgi:hypothetical protein